MPIPYDKQHIVFHASEIPMLEDDVTDKTPVYEPLPQPKLIKYSRFEIFCSKQFYKLASLIIK